MTRDDVPPGKGQCDIRLQIDDQVEVAVRGDTVFLRTLSGREGRDDGSECNFPLPDREFAGFRFEVMDSRNEIHLTEEPSRRNNFTAIVRIRDSDGGYGRYHFRLSWMMGGPPPETDRPRRDMDDRRGGDAFALNNVIHYGGRGTGSAVYNDNDLRRLQEVSLDIDRGGHVSVSFRSDRARPIVFTGVVMGREGPRLKIDAMSEDRRLRGSMSVTVNDRMDTVSGIDMDATDGRDRVRVHWDRR
jgi:hypothetical protein